MDQIDIIAVVGACAPERRTYAQHLAAQTGRMLLPAARLGAERDPARTAAELAPWAARTPGAVAEFPSTTVVTEVIGELGDPDGETHLTGIVCVVDALHLLDDLAADDFVATDTDAHGRIRDCAARALLTVTQIELASLILLVNWDGLSTPELSTLMALVSHLSPRARLQLQRDAPPPATTALVDASAASGFAFVPRFPAATPAAPTRNGAPPVPDRVAYNAAQDRAGWMATLSGGADPHMTDPRVTAFRYEQVRPVHPGRLQRVLDERIEPGEFGRIVRSAGFCTFATRPHAMLQWDHVGHTIAFQHAHAGAPGDEDLLTVGQDLAFIGLDLDVDGLAAALDGATLTDAELAAGPTHWARFDDPFPHWVPTQDLPH